MGGALLPQPPLPKPSTQALRRSPFMPGSPRWRLPPSRGDGRGGPHRANDSAARQNPCQHREGLPISRSGTTFPWDGRGKAYLSPADGRYTRSGEEGVRDVPAEGGPLGPLLDCVARAGTLHSPPSTRAARPAGPPRSGVRLVKKIRYEECSRWLSRRPGHRPALGRVPAGRAARAGASRHRVPGLRQAGRGGEDRRPDVRRMPCVRHDPDGVLGIGLHGPDQVPVVRPLDGDATVGRPSDPLLRGLRPVGGRGRVRLPKNGLPPRVPCACASPSPQTRRQAAASERGHAQPSGFHQHRPLPRTASAARRLRSAIASCVRGRNDAAAPSAASCSFGNDRPRSATSGSAVSV